MRLFEVLSRWLGRVEIALAFADDALRDGEAALARGEPLRAEAAAKLVLERVPGSVLALALLADAREAAGLREALIETLEALAERVPSRAEVWNRLGAARRATDAPRASVRDAFVRAIGVAAPGSEARREALLALTDLDLEDGDAARAELWLAGLAPGSREVALRQAELHLARHDAAGALRELTGVPEGDATDARTAMALGKALALAGKADAFAPIMRAYVLDAPGASELLASALGWLATDDALRARARALVEAHGETDLARFRAAFARAEGRRDEARAALAAALAGGDATAAAPLLDAAIDDDDGAALRAALAGIPSAERSEMARAAAEIVGTWDLSDDAPPEVVADAMHRVGAIELDRLAPLAARALLTLARRFVPESGISRWPLTLARLEHYARTLRDLEGVSQAGALALESARPVRLAIVGEFNAGKSTFVNALIGQDVAPTGILPTTATLHHLRYGPDPLARITLLEGPHPTRIVPVAELRKTLAELGDGAASRVDIELPLAFLTRVEVIDTPGFNAPNAKHTEAARRALDEADVLLWLLDASQPLKQSERVVLDEARRARIPVQILVGKSDRVGEADRAKILDLVRELLAETQLGSLAPPVTFSAKLALAGKLGQDGALEESGWPSVQRILDEDVIARSDLLKERALRRRALTLTSRLAAEAAARGATEAEATLRVTARQKRLGALAAEIERDEAALAAALARSLEGAEGELDRELSVTAAVPSGDADGTWLRYRVERTVARLAPTLSAALAGMTPGADLPPRDYLPLARLLVRSVALAVPRGPLREALARATVPALADHLRALAVAAPPADGSAALGRELSAFARALA